MPEILCSSFCRSSLCWASLPENIYMYTLQNLQRGGGSQKQEFFLESIKLNLKKWILGGDPNSNKKVFSQGEGVVVFRNNWLLDHVCYYAGLYQGCVKLLIDYLKLQLQTKCPLYLGYKYNKFFSTLAIKFVPQCVHAVTCRLRGLWTNG